MYHLRLLTGKRILPDLLALALAIAIIFVWRDLSRAFLRDAGNLALVKIVMEEKSAVSNSSGNVATRLLHLGDAQRSLGILSSYYGDWDSAVQYYQKALELKPKDTVTQLLLADVLLDQGRSDLALAIWREFDVGTAVRFLARRSEAASTLGNLEGAEQWAGLAVDLEPTSALGHYQLGLVLQSMSRLDQAKDQMTTAVVLERDPIVKSRYLWSLGRVYRAVGDNEKAENEYRQAIALWPGNIEARDFLAWICMETGRYGEAEELWRGIQEESPEYLNAYLGMGDSNTRQGNLSEAERWYNLAQKVNPRSAQPHVHLAGVLMGSGHSEEAFKHLQIAIEMSPKYIDAWLYLGRYYRLVDKPEAAIDAYCHATSLLGNSQPLSWYHSEFAVLLEGYGYGTAASEVWQNVLNMDPSNRSAVEALRRLAEASGIPLREFCPSYPQAHAGE
jgi:tetratricopeptide (TPR) repeat protein